MSSNNPQGQNQHADNNDSQRKNQGSRQAEQSNDPSGNRQQGQNDPSGSSGKPAVGRPPCDLGPRCLHLGSSAALLFASVAAFIQRATPLRFVFLSFIEPAPSAMNTSKTPPSDTAVHATVQKQRRIQTEQDRHDTPPPPKSKAQPTQGKGSPAAPGPGHAEPAPPLPDQHLTKPGLEADMELKPQFEAAHYRGSDKLKGFSTLVTGGDSGIGRAVAVLFAREGADVAIAYLAEHEDAEQTS